MPPVAKMSQEGSRGHTGQLAAEPTGALGPENAGKNVPEQPRTQHLAMPYNNPQSQPTTPILGDMIEENTSDEDETHFTLKKSIDPSKYTHLFCLKPKLTAMNYLTWTSVIIRALHTVGLHMYLSPDFHAPASLTYDTRYHRMHWSKVNHFVCSVLTACMSEEVQNQLGHLPTTLEIWAEAQRLYANTTTMDWTLTITLMVTTHHTDSKDIATHIAKMKTYRRDLILMQHDINDELFACFL